MKAQPDAMRGYRRWSVLCGLLILGLCLGLSAGAARASVPVDAGYRTISFANGSSAGCNSTPTGEKPESKLWFNDGVWWGSLCHGASKTYHIYQFDLANQDWIDTGTQLDNRPATKADVLWDETAQKLYVASASFTNSGAASSSSSSWARLYRYSYSSSSKRYTLDSGFPVTVSKGKSETITLTKDSTGTLWVTYVEDRKVMLNHSRNGNDADWGTPYVLPATGANNLTSDDISSLISFGDRIGVMWSNQGTKIMYFAVHQASDANDLNWESANAYNPGGSGADDHINLKMLQNDPAGVVFAATKTSFTGSQPLINLLVCRTFPCTSAAQWQAYQIYTGSDDDTRPVLEIDVNSRKLHVFTANTGSAGEIAYKSTSLDNIQFASGNGQLIIKNAGDLKINNPTSTKQYVSSATGVLVAASSQTTFYYYHYYNSLTGGPPPTPPVITSFSPTSGAVGSEVTITGSRFTGATAVTFNGTAASFVVDSSTQIRATVPMGATTGPIRVTTSQGSAQSAANFNVAAANQAPSVNAGTDQAVNLPNSATLSATVGDDGLPNPPGALSLQWSKVSGPGTVTFGSPTAANTTAGFSVSGSYVLRITANDGALSAFDDVEIKVNAPPSVNAGADQSVTLPAAAALAATVSDDGLPNPPGTLSLQWSKSSGPGTVTFANVASATTSATFSADGVYVLRLTVNDGGAGSWDELTVTVNPAPVNQPPAVNAGPDQTITSPASASLAGTANDDGLPNPPGALTLQWSKVSGPGSVTFGSPTTGATSAGFTATGVYVLRLTANDGALSGSDDLTVTVNPAAPSNQAPSVNAGADQSVTLPAGAALAATVNDDGLPNPPGALTLQWSKSSGPGTVTFGSPTAANTTASFSAVGVYVLRITANDGALSAGDDLTVTVSDGSTPTPPAIMSFSPASGAVGSAVTINGSGFSGATAVTFNGAAAPFVVESDSRIRATVPEAATSGPLSVTTSQGSATSANSFTVEAPPVSGDIIYISLASSATVAGMDIRDEDILAYDTDSNTWTLYFDGSDVGLSASDVNAFDLRADGSILMSLNTLATVPADNNETLNVTPVDILRFKPKTLGSVTTGTFELFFQGAAVGLENTTSEVIDALAVFPNGDLLLSLAGSYDLPGVVAGRDEDLIRFAPSQPGVYSSGTFSYYFEGSDVGLSDTSDEDVSGVWLDPGSDDIYLSTKGVFSVAGLNGDGTDIFICTPSSVGSTTACSFRAFWSGALRGLSGELIDAFDIDKGGQLSGGTLSQLQASGEPAEPQAPDIIEEDDGWPDTDNWLSLPYLLTQGQ